MIIAAGLQNDQIGLRFGDVAQAEHTLDVDEGAAGQGGLEGRVQPLHHVAVLRAHGRHVDDLAFDQLDGGLPVQQAYFGHPVIFFRSEAMPMRPAFTSTGEV